jgi:hypothetical protein
MLGRSGQVQTRQQALLNESALTWTLTGTGKGDANQEEGWTLLPGGKVLTIDVNQSGSKNYELYDSTSGLWSTPSNNTVVELYGHSNDGYPEIGPAVLRPGGPSSLGAVPSDGTNTSHTAIYNVSAGTWTQGPDLPSVAIGTQNYPLTMGDAPAALLRNGKVLISASPYAPGQSLSSYFFVFDGTSLCQLTQNAPASLAASWNSLEEMLMLPTGQVLITGSFDPTINPNQYFYTFAPTDSTLYSGAPTINTQLAPTIIHWSTTYQLYGTGFNGVSQESAYGDDFQNATNYPLVRITNTGTGHVFYLRTHDHSTMGVATGGVPTYTHFDVPSGLETGLSHLVVIANGLASSGITVNVQQ